MAPVSDPGLIAIMHVDVEGSTALATRAGDEVARRVLAETKRLVRERAEARGGREIDAVGDAMMLTFASARSAIGAATEIQEAVADRESQRPDETLRIRIGINVGEVLGHDAHPFGAAVNAGARVMGKADGGEILISELAQGLAGTIPGLSYLDRGRHSFKGFDKPWRLYQVVWPGAPAPRPRERRHLGRRGLAAAGLAATVVAVATVAATLLLTGSTLPVTAAPNSVVAIDPKTNKIVAAIPVGNGPAAITTGLGSVWVVNAGEQTLSRIDPTTRTATRIGSPVGPTSVAVGGGALWVATSDHKLARVDPATRAVAETRRLPRQSDPLAILQGPSSVAAGQGGVWATGAGTLVQIRPRSATMRLSGCCGILAVGGLSVWVVNQYGLVHVDLASGSTSSLQLAFSPSSLALGAGDLWATDTAGNAVWRIDPATDRVRDSVHVPDPIALAVGAGSVWVATTDGTVVRVDPNSSPPVVEQTFHVNGTPAGIAVGEGLVWVSVD